MVAQKIISRLLCITIALFIITVTVSAQESVSKSTRSNPENFEAAEQLNDPRDILKKVPPFVVEERTKYLETLDYYPCSDCHEEDQIPNPRVRVLEEEHESINLVHGKGRFWCLTCHSLNNRNILVSLNNQPISFNDSYLLCGQCHFQRQKDFFYGAHGKRKDNWDGPRIIFNCPECHNPHVPKIKPRKPVAMPKVRSGLEPMKLKKHESALPWIPQHQSDD